MKTIFIITFLVLFSQFKSIANINYIILTHQLCDGLTTDSAKVRAIYDWITHNIKYDIKSLESGNYRVYEANEVLARGKAICTGYTKLFVAMCREVNIKAESIEGVAKDFRFDNGNKIFEPNHEWVAVFINNKWELVDPTFGAGNIQPTLKFPQTAFQAINKKKIYYAKKNKFVFDYDSTYFAQNPKKFLLDHLPADPLWQLSDTIMPIKIFEGGNNAVKNFTEKTTVKKFNLDLSKYTVLNEEDKILNSADRTSNYNSYFINKQLQKNNILAERKLKSLLELEDPRSRISRIDTAKRFYKKNIELLQQQKQNITEEYATLRKINQEKKIFTMKYRTELAQPSRKFYAQCNREATVCKKKILKSNEQQNELKKIAIEKKLSNTNNLNKKVEIEKIKTNLKTNTKEINSLNEELAKENTELNTLINKNNKIYENLVELNEKSLDAFKDEIKKRFELYDNLDDEVIKHYNIVHENKIKRADSLQNEFHNNHQTISTLYNNVYVDLYSIANKQIERLQAYKELENLGDTIQRNTIEQQNAATEKALKETADCLYTSQKYYNTSIGNYTTLSNIYKSYEKGTAVLKKIESYRVKFSKKNLALHEKHNKNVNKQNTIVMKQNIKVADSFAPKKR